MLCVGVVVLVSVSFKSTWSSFHLDVLRAYAVGGLNSRWSAQQHRYKRDKVDWVPLLRLCRQLVSSSGACQSTAIVACLGNYLH
eukprot:3367776-Amphidinium_carterae.1